MTPVATPDKATALRIERALKQPGATGKKGFLLWVEAAYPKAIAQQVLNAVKPHVGLQRIQGSMAGFGDADPGDPGSWPVSVQQSYVTQATDSSAASPSWIDSIAKLLPVLGQGLLTKQQMDANNQLFQVNLQRAQMVPPLPPLASNPTAYGLPAPTVNFGLAGGTMQAVLWIAGGLGAVWVLTSLFKHGGRGAARRH